MKKILFWILTFLWIWLSFCSAWEYTIINDVNWYWSYTPEIITLSDLSNLSVVDYVCEYDVCKVNVMIPNDYSDVCMIWYNYEWNWDFINTCLWLSAWNYLMWWAVNWNFTSITLSDWQSSWSSSPEITIYYNNWQSSTWITCDWTQAIEIQWLSTITSTNTFTPYFNIDYIDENNQLLTESYSKDILYLSGSTFKKTYTWNNLRILTTDTIESPTFSWYLPTFEITWWIDEVTESWNIFNNFAENSVKFTLSNIPSYIQYVILLFILFFILGFIRKFRRK